MAGEVTLGDVDSIKVKFWVARIASIFFPLVIFFASPSSILAKSYSIPRVDAQVHLHTDRSADFTEIRAYSFSGDYTFAYRYIPTSSGQSVRNISITDETGTVYSNSNADINTPNTFFTQNQNNQLYIKWFFRASNQTKTFNLYYTISNVSIKHADVGEFYWKLIGSEWTLPQSQITAIVYLPGPVTNNQIYAFAHGPLDGLITIPSANQVNFSLPSLPANRYFEVRVLFTPSLLSGLATGQNKLSTILSEEKQIVENTKNDQSTRILAGRNLSKRVSIILVPLLVLVLCLITHLVYMWFRYGRELRLPQVNLSGYLHDPPTDTSPAVVANLLNLPLTDLKPAFVSTILDLVRRRLIKIIKLPRKPSFLDFLSGLSGQERNWQFGLQLLDHRYLLRSNLTNFEKHLLNIFFVRSTKTGQNTYEQDLIDVDSQTDRVDLSAKEKEYLEKLASKKNAIGFKDFSNYVYRNPAMFSAFRKWARLIMNWGGDHDLLNTESNKKYWAMNPSGPSLRKVDFSSRYVLRLLTTILFIGVSISSIGLVQLLTPEITMAILIGLVAIYLATLWGERDLELVKIYNGFKNLLVSFLITVFLISTVLLPTLLSLIPVLLLSTITGLYILFVWLITIVSKHIGKRTEKGTRETAEWLAYKKYLQNYRVTINDPIDSLVIWEKHLVYGTAVGVSAKALANIPTSFPKTDQDLYNNYYAGFSGSSSTFTHSFSSFSHSWASSVGSFSGGFGAAGVGGGGGFSGGGGGGAG